MAQTAARAHNRVEKGPGLTEEARSPAIPEASGSSGEAKTLDFPKGSEVDAALVARALSGDRGAFENLVRRHLKVAYPVALSRTGNPQDAFVTALDKLDSCERPEHFRAWFLTIVRNRAHNMRKYQDVRSAQPLEHAAAASTRDDPERDVDRERVRDRINGALAQLTDLQRNVVVLHDYEGWKHKEIGEKLGISPGASRFHLHVARKRLREELHDLKSYLPGERP